jgi:hypothetical protein
LVVSADIAVARFFDLFVVWWCDSSVHTDSLVVRVFLAFGA